MIAKATTVKGRLLHIEHRATKQGIPWAVVRIEQHVVHVLPETFQRVRDRLDFGREVEVPCRVDGRVGNRVLVALSLRWT